MRMREVWSRSSEVAGISHVLCKHYTKLRPDQATLAGLVHALNSQQDLHILTVEDPIEFVHQNLLSLVNQRERAGRASDHRRL